MKILHVNRYALFFVLLMAFSSAFSQTGTISGRVLDETNKPLPGATVYIKATQKGTTTDASGNYKLTGIRTGNVSVTVTFIGYEEQEKLVNLAEAAIVNFQLNPMSSSLTEVVVIGYGTQRRQDLTGSVTSVGPKDFNRGVVGSADQLLVGKVPGLTIARNGGDPTGGSTIQLRGPSSLTAGTNPFYVIDGVPGADLNIIAPEDIASIDVLRDASSTAIYGSRAANGVIMVTTKRGKVGKPVISYSAYGAVESVSNRVDVLSADEYNAFLTANNLEVTASEGGASTDWQDQLYHQGLSYNHNLSLSGGTEATKYSASLNYFKNDGIVKNNDLQRITGRVTLDQNAFNDRVRLGFTLSNTNGFSNHVDYGIFNGAGRYLPVSPITSDNPLYARYGGYFQVPGRTNYNNPVAMLNQRDESQERNTILGNARVGIDIVSGLVLDLSGSLQRMRYDQSQYQSREDFGAQAIGIGWANRRSTKDTEKIFESTLTYSKNIQDHQFKVLGGYSHQNTIAGDGVSAISTNFTSDALGSNNLNSGNTSLAGNGIFANYPNKQSSTLISFFGRVNYNYASKYLLSATVRQDGSSKFGENNRWAIFPSVGVAWRISEESFMKDQKVFNDLKLRASYGTSGNQNITPYASFFQYGPQTDQFYYNGNYIASYGPTQAANPDLKWESTTSFDLGLDFALLNSALTGSVDYYNKDTKDLLYTYDVDPGVYGFNTLLANGGTLTNEGIELMLNANIIRKGDLTWTSSINLSHNKNTIGSTNAGQLTITNPYVGGFTGIDGWTGETVSIVRPGDEIGTFYTRKYVGYDPASKKTIYMNPAGELETSDQSAARSDYQAVGQALPDLTYGWNNSFTYKQFDLGFFFRGMYGNQIFNATRADLSRLNAATITNQSTLAVEEGIFEAPVASSRFIEDGSFLRLDNATLGYTLNIKTSKYIRNARFYVTGQNIFTITNYSGVDPEVNLGGLNPGIDDRNYYPKTRSFLLGLNVGF